MTRIATTAAPAAPADADWTAFVAQIHQSLDLDRVGYTIVNETRRIIGCDRVSLAVVRGGSCELLAVSGQEAFDRRANLVRAIEQLCEAATPGNEPIWHHDDNRSRAPQVELPLRHLLDLSHARMLAALPLARAANSHDGGGETSRHSPKGDELLGWLVVERFDVEQPAEAFRAAAATAAAYGAPALENALRYRRLPLRRAGEAMERVFRGRMPTKTALVLGVTAIVAAVLMFVPATLKIEAGGTLEPRERRRVFAPEDGIVVEVAARHGDNVAAGQTLVRLLNPDLELEWTRVSGELNKVDQEIVSVEAKRLGNVRPDAASPSDLSAELVRLNRERDGLRLQRDELANRRNNLTIAGPITGRVLTWDVENQLAGRPVKKGQLLLTLGNVAGPWELDLRIDDAYIDHVRDARRDGGKPKVEYLSASEAQTIRDAELDDLAMRGETDAEGRASVRAAALVTSRPPAEEMRPGAVVAAKIHCGRASLGYVWMIDFIQMFRTKVMF